MRIRSHRRDTGFDIALQGDLVHLQIVITQRQRFVQHLADVYVLLLRLTLSGER